MARQACVERVGVRRVLGQVRLADGGEDGAHRQYGDRSVPPIRIASVPAGHPYVEHLGTRGVRRLPDPPPRGAPHGRWWPPVMVDPAWIRAHAPEFDLFHVHFGVESFTPGHLAATIEALREADRPLVHTVHDLTNPQLAEQGAHEALLDVLVPAAAALITLTPGAAREVDARWGRRPEVIAHPHVLPRDVAPPAGRPRRGRTVGLHLRDLRPNVDGPGATAALLSAVRLLRTDGCEVTARVELHPHVRDEPARDAVRSLCAGVGWAELAELPRPSDAVLAAALADLDASVLPYRHGTHSGWIELCWDLGVPVAAPRLGHWLEQHGPPAVEGFTPGSPPELARALRAAFEAPRPGSPERIALQRERRTAREDELEQVAGAHLAVYRRVLRRGSGVTR